MASNQKASTAMDVFTLSKLSTATIAEGCACAIVAGDGDTIGNVTGAEATSVFGIVTNAGGVVSGDRANVQILGRANVLLAASTSCQAGDELVTAAAAGTLKPKGAAVDGKRVVAIAEQDRSSNASAQMVPAILVNYLIAS